MSRNSEDQGRLSGRICVIAGAGGAIAGAVAARLTAEGGRVIGIDRRPLDVPFPVVAADLRSEAETRLAFERIHAESGRIDVLHVNAGPVTPPPAEAGGFSLTLAGVATDQPGP
ncbi:MULTISPECIES: SDR family NAD(P)-dependent oxidoreductase [unclassified Kitasatospora]|uniref:SDR family NAD(P)-dependent oxidoreductase n=1 Tax=unclassified Kitasatospora TaxID=2633591 RepID=UPI003661595B